ncbi:hypothetical protein EVAR_63413_1 [Eumeta japonica]|uniref:Uncharacterized protein n=1 Tax=Eumeta variegata TaxID=151549 RepID=A0A4C1YYF8_EUMVA|nr:hypothetical protein EVAR_63413_1 [Eumeta japonica]
MIVSVVNWAGGRRRGCGPRSLLLAFRTNYMKSSVDTRIAVSRRTASVLHKRSNGIDSRYFEGFALYVILVASCSPDRVTPVESRAVTDSGSQR